MSEPSLPSQSHQRFGPYTTAARLGQGGMGVVYLARREGTGEEVALKTVRLAKRANLAGIRSEIKALASLRHPGIVRIEDFGVENGAPWYTMELLHGQSLGEFVTQMWVETLGLTANSIATVSDVESMIREPLAARIGAGPASHVLARGVRVPAAAGGRLPEFLRITRDLCLALSYLHGSGLLHGDVKPSNIFICQDGRAVLLDFGLVSRSRGSVGREVLESAGAIRGTLPYLAPERLRGDFADARADLFGIGVILFEAVTGQLPFGGERADEILAAQQAGLTALPSQLATDVPFEVDRLISDLLAFSPQNRLGHAEDVVGVLESLGVPPAAHPVAGTKSTYLYRPPLAGRALILDRLLARMTAAMRGHGGIVLLTGESGVGKTALMAELGRRGTQQRLTVVNGECIPVGAGGETDAEIKEAPLHPFRGLLQDLADRCSEWPVSTIDSLLGPRVKLLARYEPALGSIHGADRFPEPVDLPAEAALQRLMRELRSMLGSLPSVGGPLLMLIDDLQWADELSLRFLESLDAQFFRDRPILIVATVRGDEMNSTLRSLAGHDVVESIKVDRLDEAGVEQMIGGMLSIGKPPLPLVRFMAAHSEGNPFFVAEYLRLAVEERLIVRQDGRWRITKGQEDLTSGFDSLSLPVSIRELVVRRLGGLSKEGREAVDVAAVIGRNFEVALLAHVIGIDQDQTLVRLKEPISLNIVQDTGIGAFRFAHDKLREAAYASLSPARKRQVHADVARAIEARCEGSRAWLVERSAELVHHFKLAEDPASALQYLEMAGEVALRKSAHRDAASYLEDAIIIVRKFGLNVSADRLARWERMIGDAYLALGEHERSLAHFRDALSSLGAPVPSGRGKLVASILGQIALQVTHRTGLRRLPRSSHQASLELLERMQIHDRLLQVSYYTGAELPRMMHAMASSLNLAERAGPSPYLALGYVNAAATAGILPVRKLADRYFSLARKALDGHPHPEVETFVNLLEGHYRFGCGDFAKASQLLTQAIDVSERLGFVRRWEENAGLYRCVLAAQGRFDESRKLGNKILASAERGDRQIRCWELVGRAHVSLVMGDPGRALQDARLAVELAAGQLRQERLRAHGALASALLRCGDLDGAGKAADIAMVEVEAGPPLGPYWLDPFCDVADVRLAAWDRQRSDEGRQATRRALRALLKLASVFPFAAARVELYRGRFLNRLGKILLARKAWSRGIALANTGGLPYELALNEVELGASLPPSDPERRHRLERGRDNLRNLGAGHALSITEATLEGSQPRADQG